MAQRGHDRQAQQLLLHDLGAAAPQPQRVLVNVEGERRQLVPAQDPLPLQAGAQQTRNQLRLVDDRARRGLVVVSEASVLPMRLPDSQ